VGSRFLRQLYGHRQPRAKPVASEALKDRNNLAYAPFAYAVIAFWCCVICKLALSACLHLMLTTDRRREIDSTSRRTLKNESSDTSATFRDRRGALRDVLSPSRSCQRGYHRRSGKRFAGDAKGAVARRLAGRGLAWRRLAGRGLARRRLARRRLARRMGLAARGLGRRMGRWMGLAALGLAAWIGGRGLGYGTSRCRGGSCLGLRLGSGLGLCWLGSELGMGLGFRMGSRLARRMESRLARWMASRLAGRLGLVARRESGRAPGGLASLTA
jgi:hypothetical protein